MTGDDVARIVSAVLEISTPFPVTALTIEVWSDALEWVSYEEARDAVRYLAKRHDPNKRLGPSDILSVISMWQERYRNANPNMIGFGEDTIWDSEKHKYVPKEANA